MKPQYAFHSTVADSTSQSLESYILCPFYIFSQCGDAIGYRSNIPEFLFLTVTQKLSVTEHVQSIQDSDYRSIAPVHTAQWTDNWNPEQIGHVPLWRACELSTKKENRNIAPLPYSITTLRKDIKRTQDI